MQYNKSADNNYKLGNYVPHKSFNNTNTNYNSKNKWQKKSKWTKPRSNNNSNHNVNAQNNIANNHHPNRDQSEHNDQVNERNVGTYVITGGRPDNPDNVLLDSGAQTSCFTNPRFLTNVRPSNNIVKLKCFGNNDIVIDQVGDFYPIGTVYYHPNGRTNLLSLSQITALGDVKYNKQSDEFEFKHRETNTRLRFVNCDGLYILDNEKANYVTTVLQNEKSYTKQEIERAKDAGNLWEDFIYPDFNAMKSRLHHGIYDCDITAKDLERYVTIYGIPPARIRGKATEGKPSRLLNIPQPDKILVRESQELFADIMHVAQHSFLVTVSKPLSLIVINNIRDSTAATVLEEIETQIALYKSEAFQITRITSDGEKCFESNVENIHRHGIRMNVVGAGSHVPPVERQIRRVKEAMRTVSCGLPYPLFNDLVPWLAKYSVQRINFIPSKTESTGASPKELFMGKKLNLKVDLPIRFGEYVEVYNITNPNDKNSMEPRTVPCLSLISANNESGSVLFFNLITGNVIKRNKWVRLPISEPVMTMIRNWIDKHGRVDPDDQTWLDVIDQSLKEGESKDSRDIATSEIFREPHSPHHIEVDFEESEETSDENIGELPVDPERQARIESTDSILQELNDLRLQYEKDQLNESVEKSVSCNYINSGDIREFVFYNLTTDEAIELFGNDARMSIESELLSIDSKHVWDYVKVWELDATTRKSIIPCKLFLKPKFIEGAFDKLKSRLVAGGHRQIGVSEIEAYSPTAAFDNILVSIVIGSAYNKLFSVMDIGTAYLNADINAKVYMRIPKEISQILIEMNLVSSEYMNYDGTLVVLLRKALYGLKQASKLWNNTISKKMNDLGYVENEMDACIFVRMREAESDIVIVYVDDLLVISSSIDEHKRIRDEITKSFRNITISANPGCKVFHYLGMKVSLNSNKSVSFSMHSFIDNLLKAEGIECKKDVKCASHPKLFDMDDKEEIMSSFFQQKIRSVNAKLLYLSKRVRPDILLPVNYLSTRVDKYGESDIMKLIHILKYLFSTRNKELILSADVPLKLHCLSDAGYAIYPDSTSITSFGFSLGRGYFGNNVSKQRIISLSTTEAELISATSAAVHAIYFSNFIRECGYVITDVIVYQDNKSTIKLEEGSKPQRTKHLNTKRNFLVQKVKLGDLRVCYLPTENMVVDIGTKILAPKKFMELRDQLLGLTQTTKIELGDRVEENGVVNEVKTLGFKEKFVEENGVVNEVKTQGFREKLSISLVQ